MMMQRHGWRRGLRAACGLLPLAFAGVAVALPAPPPLRFVGQTPTNGKVLGSGAFVLQVDASCTFDPATLAVSVDGGAIPSSAFLPFGPCTSGRMASQSVAWTVGAPSTQAISGDDRIDAGQSAGFTASGSGDRVRWNFDGGAAPAEGSSVSAVFAPAGDFTVRARATNDVLLQASGIDGGNLVQASRGFEVADPTPSTHALTVVMPPDVDFTNFESGHVNPLALSESGDRLFALNTPENRLSIFDVAPDGSLAFVDDVQVGLDPVSLAQRPGTDEVWVVNHLSDSVSVVDTAAGVVRATLSVQDEPTDVVFASGRAFVAISGQRDAVAVFDAATLAPVATVDVFGDDPRALAASADGSEVYVVVLESGNGTTTLFHDLVSAGGGPPPPSPSRTAAGAAPETGLIVQFDPATGTWRDDAGGDWSAFVDFELPDEDLFVIDADAGTPSVIGSVPRVGTNLFHVATRPGSGELFVANTDARNLVRFEPNLRGHLVETRLSVVDPGSGSVATIDLNPHVDFSTTPGPTSERALSVAHPGAGVFSADGSRFYVTAFGSRKVAVVDAQTGAVLTRFATGQGPSGVALDGSSGALYVLNRMDHSISVLDAATGALRAETGVAGPGGFDPTPEVVRAGRPFLYDGEISSGHGDASCATCHLLGNFDNLAWDLGDPTGSFVPYSAAPWVQFIFLGASTQGFDPMKGPMTTQTLRGLQNMEPFHWRGDRQNFQHFNGAFVSLMGRGSQLPAADMDAFTDFIMTVRFPPNPYRNPDDSMPSAITVPNQASGAWTATGNPNVGASAFVNQPLDANVFTCNQCHALPTGTNNFLFNGSAEGETQDFKIPHMRNMYEKVGFDVVRPNITSGSGSQIGLQRQKAGFGFLHDGSLSLTEFLAAGVFTMGTQLERDMFAFSLAFPTETPPCVGIQLTLDAGSAGDPGALATIGQLVAEAQAGRCDLIAKGHLGGSERGYLFEPSTGLFQPDSVQEAPLSEAALRGLLAPGDALTYTGTTVGSGHRLAIDRDRDTWPDYTEHVLGTDPADPRRNPWQW